LELPSDSLVAICGIPAGANLDDPVAAVEAALVDPLDFPALVEATVPGDHVVLAVERGVPHTSAVVAGIVKTLTGGRVSAENIEIVLAPGYALLDDVTEYLPTDLAAKIAITVHDPKDSSQLAYLAAAKNGEPIYMSRAIVDADFAIPVGCVRLRGSLGNLGIPGGVFPTFADVQTQERLVHSSHLQDATQLERQRQEASESAWLLGARFMVQVIPGAGANLLHVLCGDVDSVVERAKALSSSVWDCQVPRRAELLVATLEGDIEQHSWENLGKTLHAASPLVEDGGAIVVCSDLSARPGLALSRMIGADDLESAQRAITAESSEDRLAAAQLISTLRKFRVYALSQIDHATLEDLWIAPVVNAKEVVNLCIRSKSFTVLQNSQYAVPTLSNHSMEAS